MEEQVIRPLALRFGYIPLNTDVRRLSQGELKSLITALGPDKCEYSSSADQENHNGVRQVKGTRTVFPERGPLTKYAALFDARPCFYAILLSLFFLRRCFWGSAWALKAALRLWTRWPRRRERI